jgi:radical SAM superfamily enzyme YgiQ (UPF0313 family)
MNLTTIILIRPFLKTNFELPPPVGLVSIGGLLIDNGYSVKIIDVLAGDDYKKEIESNINNCLFVGISVMTANIPSGLEISKFIKNIDSKIPVVWGGIHPTLYPRQVISDSYVDIVVVGDGEYTSLQLANCLREKGDLNEVTGILYKDKNKNIVTSNKTNNTVDLNSLPFLNYSLIDIDKYVNKNIDPTFTYSYAKTIKRYLPVVGSLGCKYRCTFCVNTIIHKRIQRVKFGDRLLDEIEFLIGKHNVHCFYIRDEDFFGDKKRVMQFLDGIEKRNLMFKWHTNVRASYFKSSYINEDLLKRMERLGLYLLGVGAESGSQKVLNILKKDISIEDIKRVASFTKNTKIIVNFSFMIGVPGEGVEDALKTVKFIKDLKKINSKVVIIGPQLYRPYPGSSLYELCLTKGFNEPKVLAEWGTVLDKYSAFKDLPWVNQSIPFNLIYLYSRVMFKNVRVLKRNAFMILKIPTFFILKFIAEFRIKFNFWSIPLETYIYNLFIRR